MNKGIVHAFKLFLSQKTERPTISYYGMSCHVYVTCTLGDQMWNSFTEALKGCSLKYLCARLAGGQHCYGY